LDASEKRGNTMKLEASEHLRKKHRAAVFASKSLPNPLKKTPRTVLLKAASACVADTAMTASA
jgi:hypothetical protein